MGRYHFKNYLRIVACVCFCVSIVFSMANFAFASEVVESTEYVPESSENVPETTIEESEEVVRTVSPITPSNTTGLKQVLVSLFGNYDTIVTEYRYTNSNGYQTVTVNVQEDYVWIISAAIFSIVLYCLFKFLGGVFFGRK